MAVHVVSVPWATHGERLRRIRERVFIEEQSVPRELEWDGFDETSKHFLAIDEHGIDLGTARLMPTGQIGRIAVLAEHRSGGIGRKLLDLAIREAEQVGLTSVFLHAQTHALGFYTKAGFIAHGPEFMEAGIPHVEMTLKLTLPFVADAGASTAAIKKRSADVGPRGPSHVWTFDDEHTARECLYTLIDGAGRYLDIQSPALDPALFDTERATTLISEFARRHATSRVRILIEDTSGIVAQGHRLLDLARRLPSKIEIRRSTEAPARDTPTFALADGKGLWLLQDAVAYAGLSTAHGPVQAQRLLLDYTRRFERAVLDPELRLLRL